jgi:spermidine synthase
MSETVVLPNPVPASPSEAVDRSPWAGISLASFSALLLELSLTRLFSVVLFYHFAFLAISTALLGLGAGGVFAYLRRAWLARFGTRALGAATCSLNAVAIVIALEVVLHTPVSLLLTGHNFKRLTLIYLCSAVPFFFTGLLFSVVFAREARRIPQLYGADLLGGAAACLGIVPLLNWLGGPNAVLFAALTMAAAAVVWSASARARLGSSLLMFALLVTIAINHNGRWIDVIYAKGAPIAKFASKVEYVRWNSISRIEVDVKEDGSRWIVIDEDANSAIMNVDPAKWDGTVWQRRLMVSPPSMANVLRPHGKYAIIGPGGGVDVVRAVGNGSPSVTLIEINPIIVNDVMTTRYADWSYHLYDLPQVRVHVSDGRSFIRGTSERYDVIQMTLVDTWASTAAGAFALSENNLYTVEAFRQYFDHLNPDGMIAITRWEFRRPREALRVVSVGMAALRQMGVSDPAGHFMVFSQGALKDDGIPVAVLAKKSAFTPEEEAAAHAHMKKTGLVAQYMPSEPSQNAFGQLIASKDPRVFARTYEFNVAPVTDNNPFFFFTLKMSQILNRTVMNRAMDWKVNLGVVVLAMVVLISIAAVLLFMVLPLWLHGGSGAHTLSLMYFVAIGLGYILVEMAFIQRFVLFLGHPTYALTVVIFLLLLSSGAGSMASRRWLAEPRRVRITLVIIAAAIVVYVLGLPLLLTALVGLPFIAKLAVSGALLIPLGFAMGMPFPTGLRWLASHTAEESGSAVEWAWAMNAASSVLGSVLAIVIAIQFGLKVTLTYGAAAYLLAFALTSTFERRAAAVRG